MPTTFSSTLYKIDGREFCRCYYNPKRINGNVNFPLLTPTTYPGKLKTLFILVHICISAFNMEISFTLINIHSDFRNFPCYSKPFEKLSHDEERFWHIRFRKKTLLCCIFIEVYRLLSCDDALFCFFILL